MGRSGSAHLPLHAAKMRDSHPRLVWRVSVEHKTKEPISSVRSKVNPSAARGARIMTPHARDGLFSLVPYHKVSCRARSKPHGLERGVSIVLGSQFTYGNSARSFGSEYFWIGGSSQAARCSTLTTRRSSMPPTQPDSARKRRSFSIRSASMRQQCAAICR